MMHPQHSRAVGLPEATKTLLLSQGTVEEKRQEIREYFIQTWEL